MGRLIPSSTAWLCLSLAAAAAPEAAAPAAPAPGPASPAAAAAAPEPAAEVARFVSSRYQLADLDSYLKRQTAIFAIRDRETGPFGLNQDPTKQPPPSKIVPKVYNKFKNIPPTPFRDVIAALKVSMVRPSQQLFLIGSDTKRRGDQFPIHYRDKSVTVEVVRVGGNRIDFRNVETGEAASHVVSLRPSGMNRASGSGAQPPGFRREDPSAPIEVQITPHPADAPSVTSAKR